MLRAGCGHTFNSSIWKAEAGGSLSLRPTWFSDPVSGQPVLNCGGQKASEDIIEPRGHVPDPGSSRIWKLQLIYLII